MSTKRFTIIGLSLAILAMALFGCATSDQRYWWSKNESQRPDLTAYPYDPYQKQEAPAAPVVKAPPEVRTELLPPNAKPGECYARVFVPPRYQTVTQRVLSRQASERVETIPAKYEEVE